MSDPGSKRDSFPDDGPDAPLREEDVTAGDRLDDRVQEGDGLPDEASDDE